MGLLVVVQQHAVEVCRQQFPLTHEVRVAAIAEGRIDDRATAMGNRIQGLDQRGDPREVVAGIAEHGHVVLEQDLETRRGRRRRLERFQTLAHGGHRDAQGPQGADRGEHILDLEADLSAERHGHAVQQTERCLPVPFGQDDHAVADQHGAAALEPVLGHERIIGDIGEVGHFAPAVLGDGGGQRIGGVDDGHAGLGRDDVDHGAFDPDHAVGGVDIVMPQVIGFAEVGDHGHVAQIEGQSALQDALAGGFEHGCLDIGVQEQAARVPRAGAIAAVDEVVAGERAFGRGLAHTVVDLAEHVRHELGDDGLAVGAADGHDRNATVLAFAEERGHDGFAHGAGFAVLRFEVHAHAGAGVDLDDLAPLFAQGAADVAHDHVHAGNVQPHHARREDGHGGAFGMHIIGHVVEVLAVVVDEHRAALARHGVGGVALFFQHQDGHGVDFDLAQRAGPIVAAARILVQLVDQLAHGARAVAGDLFGLTACGGDQLALHDQQAMLGSGHELFDHHAIAFGQGDLVGLDDLFARGEVDGHPATVVGVGRLDDHRQADLFGHGPGFFGTFGHAPFGHGDGHLAEQAVGDVLFLGDGFGDGSGEVGLGHADAVLLGSMAELHQAAGVQAAHRDAAALRRLDDGAGGWTQADDVRQLAEAFEGGGNVEGAVLDGGHEELVCGAEAGARQVLFLELDDHLVHAALGRLACAAEAHVRSGLGLEFQRDVFQDVAHVGAGLEPLEESPPLADAASMFDQRGEPGHEAFVEAGQGVGGEVLQPTDIDPGFQDGGTGPDIGPAKSVDLANFHETGARETRLVPARGGPRNRWQEWSAQGVSAFQYKSKPFALAS